MTDTRPHFYFNGDFLVGENLGNRCYIILNNGDEYCGYLSNSYGEIDTSDWISGTSSIIYVKNINCIVDNYEEGDIVSISEIIENCGGKYIGDIYLPNGNLYEEIISGSWSINNKTVKSLSVGNKEIQSIERVSDGAIIYQRKINTHFTLVNQRMIVLSDENDNLIPNKTIRVCYNDGASCSDYTTNADNPVIADGVIYSAIFNGDNDYNGCSYISEIYRYNLTASLSNNSIYTDGSTVISGQLKKDDVAWSNQTITIYDGNTSLGTCTTDSSGNYTKTISNLSAGSHTLKASHNYIDSSTVNLTVSNHTYAISLYASPSTITSGETSTLVASLTKDGSAYNDQTVTFTYGGNSYTSTTVNGMAVYIYHGTGMGSVTITASSNNVSDTVTITDNPLSHTYSLTAQLSQSTIYTDGSTVISGILTDNGSAMANETITIYDGNTSLGTCTTDSSGNYSKTISGLSSGSHTIKASHTNVESSTISLTVNNHTYNLTASLSDNSIYDDESTTISGQLKRDNAGWNGQTITIYDGSTSLGTCTTDSSGNYTKTVTGFSVGSHTLKASHTNINSSNVSLNVETSAIILTVSDVTMTYRDGTQTNARVTKKGQPYDVGGTVTYIINDNSYTATINSEGYAKRDINLSVGTYTFTITYGSLSETSTCVITKAPTTTTLNVSSQSISTTGTLTLSGQVTGPNIGNVSVRIYDGTTLKTTVTSTKGAYSTTLSSLSEGTHNITAKYVGSTNYLASQSDTITVTVSNNTMTISATKDVLSLSHSQSSTLTATLTNSSNNPISNATVTFKKGSTTLGTKTTNSSGKATYTYNSAGAGDITITAEGSGATATYNISDYLFVPPLDGTDTITKWSTLTNNTSNGVFNSHGSYLSNGWDNSGLWQLDFDVKTTSWKYVGLMPFCDPAINPFTDAKNNTYSISCWEGFTVPGGMGFAAVGTSPSYTKKTATNTTYHMTIKKTASNRIEIILENNSTYTWIRESSLLSNYSTLYFGSRDNPSSRNYGGILQFSNIVVKPL